MAMSPAPRGPAKETVNAVQTLSHFPQQAGNSGCSMHRTHRLILRMLQKQPWYANTAKKPRTLRAGDEITRPRPALLVMAAEVPKIGVQQLEDIGEAGGEAVDAKGKVTEGATDSQSDPIPSDSLMEMALQELLASLRALSMRCEFQRHAVALEDLQVTFQRAWNDAHHAQNLLHQETDAGYEQAICSPQSHASHSCTPLEVLPL